MTPPPVVPSDQDSIYENLKTLAVSDPTSYQAIVRPNNPPLGIAGFLFDIPGDDEVRLRSQISDHFLEDNTSVQDNIALEPEVITLRGMIAELVYRAQPAAAQSQTPANALPILPDMQPPLTLTQQTAYDAAQPSTTNIQSDSLYAYFQTHSNLGELNTRQSTTFGYFYQLWQGQQLLSVETPWGIWQNVAILDVRASQSSRTKYESDFTIVFKKIRFARTAVFEPGQLAGRNAMQAQPQTQDGNAGQGTLSTAEQNQLYSGFGTAFTP